VVEHDPVRARTIGRARVQNPYLGLTNYLNSLRELGYGDDDLDDGGSDRLIDDLALHGTPEEIAVRLGEHLAAGADHSPYNCSPESDADPLLGYVTLASALIGSGCAPATGSSTSLHGRAVRG
jgi:hypothetical protein